MKKLHVQILGGLATSLTFIACASKPAAQTTTRNQSNTQLDNGTSTSTDTRKVDTLQHDGSEQTKTTQTQQSSTPPPTR